MVPTLVFGIPGDSITAIVIGVLILKGIQAGRMIFVNQPEMVYAILRTSDLATLFLLPLGLVFIRLSRSVLRVPRALLPPVVLLACIVGSFAINNTVFDIWVMLAFGVVGWIMGKNGVPIAPTILSLALGKMIEFNIMATLLKSNGDLLAFFARPVAAVLGVLTTLIRATTIWRILRPAKRPVTAGGDARMIPFADAHHHRWDLPANPYPWLASGAAIPFRHGDYEALRRPFLPDDHLRNTKRQNVVTTVTMEGEWGQARSLDEARWLADLPRAASLAPGHVSQA